MLAVFYAGPLSGQKKDCSEYISGSKDAWSSRAKVIFDIGLGGDQGELGISTDGSPLTIQFNFEFHNKSSGLIAGDILTVDFADGTRYEFIYNSRHLSRGKIDFTLIKVENDLNRITEEEDKLFFEKILDVNMTSFRLRVNEDYRVIAISRSKGELIRHVITCLLDH